MRIKLTEEQYALLNEYVNGADLINENEDLVNSLTSLISKGFKETDGENLSSSEVFNYDNNEYGITFKCCPIVKKDDNGVVDKTKRLVSLNGPTKPSSFHEKTLSVNEVLRDILNRLNISKQSYDVKDDTLLSNVSIDLKISEKIKELVGSFPGEWGKGTGIDGLKKKLDFLNSPISNSGNSLTGKINALYVLSYLKKLRDDDRFEAASSGFFFESFIAGLLGVERADIKGEAKGAADIVADDKSTWSLKFYSDGEHQIQVKSAKQQQRKNITDGILLGVKTANGVDVIFYDTSYIRDKGFNVPGVAGETYNISKEEDRKNQGVYRTTTGKGEDRKFTDKWVIDQSYVRDHGERYTLNYGDVKEQLNNTEGAIMCIVEAMEKQMTQLKKNIEIMITGRENIESTSKKANNNAKTLDGNMKGVISCSDDTGEKKKGLIDKSVDVLSKSAEVQSNK